MRASLIKLTLTRFIITLLVAIFLIIALVSYFLITSNHSTKTADKVLNNTKTKSLLASQSSVVQKFKPEPEFIAQEDNEEDIDAFSIPSCPTIKTDQKALETSLSLLSEQNRTSANIDDQFIFHLLRFSPVTPKHLVFYQDYLKSTHDKPIAFYHLLNACHEQINHKACQDDLFEQANSIDPENGMLWLNIAGIKLKQGDQKGALTAIQTASQKMTYSDYHFKTIELIASNIQLNTSVEYKNAVISAIGYVAAQPATYGGVLKFCFTSEVTELEQADICHQLGQSMAENSKTIFLSSLGSSLQQAYLTKYQYDDASLASKKQNDAIYQSNFSEQSNKLTELAFNNEQLIREWLTMGEILGETRANRHMINELKWLLKDKDYNPCTAQFAQ